MSWRKTFWLPIGAGLAALALAWFAWFSPWRDRLFPTKPAGEADKEEHSHDHSTRLQLSPQARANLGILVQPVALETYPRTIQVPGMVIDQPGKSDRSVTAPITGVIKRVDAVPGDTLRPGEELFALRPISESLQSSQTELYKTTRELEINKEQRDRLANLVKSGAIAEARMIDLDAQQRRLASTAQALRYDLAARGLSAEQVLAITEGKFVTEFIIRAPERPAKKSADPITPDSSKTEPDKAPLLYEVEDLKVQLGEHVQAGQTLLTLATHQSLYAEGRVFKQEIPLLEHAVEKSWPVQVTSPEEQGSQWQPIKDKLTVQFLANKIDPGSQTIPFYVPLPNAYREHGESGKVFRVWRFRPGQRIRLKVQVDEIKDVFVLPAEAVAREGPEVFVFRANGNAFDRRPVHVVYEDPAQVVIANDGSISAGNHIAHNGAAALNRALKAKATGEGHGGHDHHGHSHDH